MELEGLFVAGAGVLAIVVAIAQYELGRRQWLVGLYEKRHPVFIATMRFLGEIAKNAGVTMGELVKLQRECRDHWLLFGKEVGEHVDRLYAKGVRLKFVAEKRAGGRVTEKKLRELGEEESDLVEWFVGQTEETKKVFGGYLKVGKRGKVLW